MKKKILIMLPVLAFLVLGMAETAMAQPDTLWTKSSLTGYAPLAKFSPDDTITAVVFKYAFDDHTFDSISQRVLFFNSQNGQFIRSMSYEKPTRIMDFDFSPNGKYLVTGDYPKDSVKALKIWDVATGNLVRTMLDTDASYENYAYIDIVKFTPDSRYIFTRMYSIKTYRDQYGQIKYYDPKWLVIDASDWKVSREINFQALPIGEDWPYLFSISPNNRYYAIATGNYQRNSYIQLRDIKNDTLIAMLDNNYKTPFNSLNFSPDSNYLSSPNDNHHLIIWDLNQNNVFKNYFMGEYFVLSYNFSNDSKYMAIEDTDTLLKKTHTKIVDFDSLNQIYDYPDFSSNVLFNNKNQILMQHYYSISVHDSTWKPMSVFERNEGNPATIVYPNPSEHKINIEFELSNPSLTTIVLYDEKGNYIKEIANREFDSGTNRIEFDTKGLANGVYFLKIVNNQINRTEKIVIVR